MTICNYCMGTEHYFWGLLDPRQTIKTTHCIYCQQLILKKEIIQRCYFWEHCDTIYGEPELFISDPYCIACKRDDMKTDIFSNETILHCDQCKIPLNTYPTLKQFSLVAIKKEKNISQEIIKTSLPKTLQIELNNLMFYISNKSLNISQ